MLLINTEPRASFSLWLTVIYKRLLRDSKGKLINKKIHEIHDALYSLDLASSDKLNNIPRILACLISNKIHWHFFLLFFFFLDNGWTHQPFYYIKIIYIHMYTCRYDHIYQIFAEKSIMTRKLLNTLKNMII